ncbi:unnamed protein product [Oikopleura dioica]|uniref:Claudin n=1 Tax=Oikopleura dioica TaxID=34765 RepID=E4WSR6_OIKDI|nr:unnamed protein product [Oikopleura dioica]
MAAFNILSSVFGLCATICAVYTCVSPYWAVSVKNSNGFNEMQERYFGLWQYCAGGDHYGTYQCQALSQFGIAQLAQYGIVGFRILAILSCIFGSAGFIAGVASSDSVNLASSKKSKKRAAGGSAALFALAGVLILAATSWAADNIIKRWKQLQMGGLGMSVNAGTQWTLGSAIYVGWISAVVFLVVSLILVIGCFREEEEDDDEHFPHPEDAKMQFYASSNYSAGRKEYI